MTAPAAAAPITAATAAGNARCPRLDSSHRARSGPHTKE